MEGVLISVEFECGIWKGRLKEIVLAIKWKLFMNSYISILATFLSFNSTTSFEGTYDTDHLLLYMKNKTGKHK